MKRSYFGEATYVEVRPTVMHDLVERITSLLEMSVYPQTLGNWSVENLIAQKMARSFRSYRAKQNSHVMKRRLDQVNALNG